LTSPAISATVLHKTYGNVVALDDASFDVADGAVLGLLGPDGSGETGRENLALIGRRSRLPRAAACDRARELPAGFGRPRVSLDQPIPGGGSLRRADLAEFMLDAIDRPDTYRRRVRLASPRK
jgi:hypothetical protein